MFCSSCGKEIPDDAKNCPGCEKPVTDILASKKSTKKKEKPEEDAGIEKATTEKAQASDNNVTDQVQADVTKEDSVQVDSAINATEEPKKEQKPKSDIDTNIGAYLKAFFKDPFEAILSRSTPKYMVWGLIILGAYALLVFLGELAASTGAAYSFASMFCLACGLAAMIFSLFLFQEPMKLEKKSLNEIVAVVGLSMTPMFVLYFVGSVIDAAAFSYLSFWQSVLNFRLFTPPLVTVGYIFSALILGRFYTGDDQSKLKRSLLLILIAFGAFFLIESLFMYVAIRVG